MNIHHQIDVQAISSQLDATPILSVKAVSKYFSQQGNSKRVGLEDISLDCHEGEIIAILGQSGSGKSTLLRLLSGLIEPSEGTICYRNEVVAKPLQQSKMVFQHYALLPWMTVAENIAFGLSIQGVHPTLISERVELAMAMIGISGFACAYPSQLSGGMCQRVGFARPLVTQPEILLLDEPFSALDALTARRLKKDFLHIWGQPDNTIKSVVLVTHDVDEAIQMADHIIVLASNPGRVFAQLKLSGSDRHEGKHRLAEQIYHLLENASGA